MQWMRLDDVTVTMMTAQLMTSQQVRGSSDQSGRWSTDQTERSSVLTITDVSQRDSGLFVCYHATSTRQRSDFLCVFRLRVSDDNSSVVFQGLLLQFNIRYN